ncbi:MAG TPA: protein translocase subunit SecF [Burkholderiaceae bacterium]|nr:protein translocase subunit SecF [Burkholderiaceae bacterium]
MEFFKIRRDIPFMRYALIFNVISALTFVLAVYFLFAKGLNLGVDFTGGTVLEVSYAQPAEIPKIRDAIGKLGFRDVSVQNFGTSRDVMIRLPAKAEVPGAKISEQVFKTLCGTGEVIKDKCVSGGVTVADLKRVEFVGPQVGRELIENGIYALLAVSLGIVLYLWLRFEWKFGVSAIVANLHDVVIILGFFAFFQWDFSLTVLAAVLAILGYSVNESVVVFDRIRENFRKMRKRTVPEIIDNAITATMSRTIITHACTQLAVLSMLIFGGETLHYFALALTIGICFGIYSSVLVGSPLLMWLGLRREDLARPEAEKKSGESGAIV